MLSYAVRYIKNKQRNVFQLNAFYNYQLSNYTKE